MEYGEQIGCSGGNKMNLEFRKPNLSDVEEITNFKKEFEEAHSGMDGTGILVRCCAEEWLDYIDEMEKRDNPNSIPCLQYGLFCKENNRLLGLEKVLVTCLEDNIGSAKTIEGCGGIFEKIVYDDVNYKANMKRYWIPL